MVTRGSQVDGQTNGLQVWILEPPSWQRGVPWTTNNAWRAAREPSLRPDEKAFDSGSWIQAVVSRVGSSWCQVGASVAFITPRAGGRLAKLGSGAKSDEGPCCLWWEPGKATGSEVGAWSPRHRICSREVRGIGRGTVWSGGRGQVGSGPQLSDPWAKLIYAALRSAW